jgi:hypothetical protein
VSNTRRKSEHDSPRRGRPAKTPEGREQQLVGLAVELAERQLRDGTASAQVISHYLKMGSSREELEQEKIRHDIEMQQARIEHMESQSRMEELYSEAINAMRIYAGQDPLEVEAGYDDEY